MSFLSINTASAFRNSKIFFIAMIGSWMALLVYASFSKNPFAADTLPILPIVIVAVITPIVISIYGWIPVSTAAQKKVRIYGLVSAMLATSLAAFSIFSSIA